MSLETKMTRNGIVVSNKADKTVVVQVERKFQHPLYHRTVKQTAKFMAHDETNACSIGDLVKIITRKPHPRYKKSMARTTRLYVHDEENTLKVGDKVRVAETRPLSKLKRWRIVEVLERAK